MKLLQESERKLSSIRLPGGWDKNLDKATIEKMRATVLEAIKVHGRDEAPKHIPFPPVILDQGDRLHAGRHRFFVFKSCSLASIRTAKYEFSGPREAEMVELRENLHRRQLPDDEQARATKRLVELLEAEAEEQDRQIEREADAEELETQSTIRESASKPGPKKSAHGKAIDRAADEIGISSAGVRKRLERVEKLAQASAEPEVALEMWGMDELPGMSDLRVEAGRLQKAFDSVSALCARAVGALAEVDDTLAARRWPALHELKEEIHKLGRVARALRPEAVCPFCKSAVDGCPTCNGRELVGAGELERAPDDLKLGGDHIQPMVCIGPGQLVPLAQGKGRTYGGAAATKKAKGGAKKVKVVDQDGQPLIPPDPEPAADDDGTIPF